MGQAGGKEAIAYDQKQIQEKYHLTESQVQTLVAAFQKQAPKGKVDKNHFIKIVATVRAEHPELAKFNDEIVGLIFTFCDTEHHGKLDPFEVVAALSTFAQGEVEEKAKLVFKTIDKDHGGVLTKDEIRAHAKKIHSFSATLVKKDIKDTAKGALGSIAAAAMGTALGALESQFIEDIVRDVMTVDTDKDGYVSEAEWLAAAKTNNTVKALIDPNLSANAWRVLFGMDVAGTAEMRIQLIQLSPKGFATIFDWEVEEGKFETLGKQAPPPDRHITITSTKGGEATKEAVAVNKSTTFQEVLDKAAAISDLPKDSIALFAPAGSIGDSRIPEGSIYDNVVDGDEVKVINYKTWTGKVLIKSLTGKTTEIDCGGTTGVAALKEAIQNKEGIPPNQQRLVYVGRQMDDEKLLSDYVVVPNAAIHLILRLRGN